MKEKFKSFFDEEVKTPKVGYFWKGFALFLLGIVIGFWLSPIKKGVKIGCNNGNNCTDSGNTSGNGSPFCDGKSEDDVDCGNFCAD